MFKFIGILSGIVITFTLYYLITGLKSDSELDSKPVKVISSDPGIPVKKDIDTKQIVIESLPDEVEQLDGESIASTNTRKLELLEQPKIEPIISKADPQKDIAETSESIPKPLVTTNSELFVFWTPFNSHYAANGFANSLGKKTGIPMQVVNDQPEIYQIAFAYSDTSDKEEKINRIRSITGLEVLP